MSQQQKLTDEQRLRLQLRLSRRHRLWGYDTPATDVDSNGQLLLESVFIEYDHARATAIIDYKAAGWTADHNTLAMADLADRAGLPAYIVQYHDAGDEPWTWRFKVRKVWLDGMTLGIGHPSIHDERGWVAFLYEIRGRTKYPTTLPTWANA